MRGRAAALLLALIGAACTATPVLPTPSGSAAPAPSPTAAPTPDRQPPSVVRQDPPPGGQLATPAALHVTFSEPVSGVDRASFQLSDASRSVLVATVELDATHRVATLTPHDELTVATTYTASLTGAVRDQAGNALTPMTWAVSRTNQVTFRPGTYTGYQFGETTANLVAIKRATLAASSGAMVAEYRDIEGVGYLKVANGIWQGYWVHGTPAGDPQEDLAAPLPPLPRCDYVDLPTARASYASWASTVLDTVFQLPTGYAPGDLVDAARAGLNAGYFVRSFAIDDLSAMVAAARADGAQLAVQSAYRSYAGQVLTFNGWVRRVGIGEALQTSARPGHSEHQLGTAIDFRTAGGASPWTYADWATSTEGSWMAANAWKFGWLMSYPRGSTAVACYRYEPWHYRYVGRETARIVHDAGGTLRQWLWAMGYGVR